MIPDLFKSTRATKSTRAALFSLTPTPKLIPTKLKSTRATTSFGEKTGSLEIWVSSFVQNGYACVLEALVVRCVFHAELRARNPAPEEQVELRAP